MCGQESDGDGGAVFRGREGEEVRSASGWITSGPLVGERTVRR